MGAHVINKLPLFLVLDAQDLDVLKGSELAKCNVENAGIFASADNFSLLVCLCLEVTNIKEGEAVGLCMKEFL